MPVNLFVGAWLARYLGPDRFGAFNYAIAFVALLAPLAGLGLDSIVVRDLVRTPDREATILGSSFIMRLIANLALVVVTCVAAWILHVGDRATQWMIFIFALCCVFSAADVIDYFYQSIVQAKYAVYARNIAFAVGTILKIVFLLLHGSVVAFAWVTLAENVVTAAALIVIYHAKGHHMNQWNSNWAMARQLLSAGWPLMLTGLVVMIYMRIDLLMLGQFLGDDAVGKYAAAERISELWFFVPMAICSSVAPNIIKTHEVNPKLCDRRTEQLLYLMVAMSYGVALVISLLARRIMFIMYGAEYVSASSILVVHVWTGIFVSLGVARNPWLVANGYLRFTFFSAAAGAVANVLLNLVLIPRYG
ncbi:MAG TPA: flippase, partial [Tepidisphaeraceae bacterium]|nr:flippase [Tepidisphaeraceae bacterium]